MTLALTFNGYSLPMPVSWDDNQDTRIASSQIIRRDGLQLDTVSNFKERLISVEGFILKSTFALAQTELDSLVHNLNIGRAQLVFDNARYIYATKDSFKKRYITNMQGFGIQYSISFLCDDPYFYDANETTQNETLTGGATQTVSITPTGLETSPMVITVTPTGSMTVLRLYNGNLSSQIWWQFDGTVAAGKNLVINTAAKTVLNDGANALANITGDFFDLRGAENNPIAITGTGHAGAMGIVYRNRWL